MNTKNKKAFLIAPSSSFKKELFDQGIKSLNKMGIKTTFRKDIYLKKYNYAGSNKRRSDEIKQAFSSPPSLIIAVRGGYGSTSILKKLKNLKIKNEKLFLGASDITALHFFFQKYHPQVKSVMGPMVIPDFGEDRINKSEFKKLIEAFFNKSKLTINLKYEEIINKGKKKLEGKSLPACLTLLNLSVGSFFEPLLKNKVLFIEDINENSSRILRMIEHLENSDRLNQINGIVFNDFPLKNKHTHTDLIKKLKDFFRGKSYPVFFGSKFGHSMPRSYIPFNFDVELVKDKITIKGIF